LHIHACEQRSALQGAQHGQSREKQRALHGVENEAGACDAI